MSVETAMPVDYKRVVRSFTNCHFPDVTLNADSVKLLAKLLNVLNRETLVQFRNNKKSGSDAAAYLHSAQMSVEDVFEGGMQATALAESSRQLGLFETGVLKYKPKMKPGLPAIDAAKKGVTAGIRKMMVSSECGCQLARDAQEIFSTRVSNLLDIIANKVAEDTRDKDEVTPTDIKKVVDEYVTGALQDAMNDEGARLLLEFTSGMIKFKPKTATASTKKTTKRKTSRTKSGSAQEKTKKTSAGGKRERSRKSKKPAKSSERKIAEEGSKRKGTGQKETSSKARKEIAAPTKRKTSRTKSDSAEQKPKKTPAGDKREKSRKSKKPAKSSERKIAEEGSKRKGTGQKETSSKARKKIAAPTKRKTSSKARKEIAAPTKRKTSSKARKEIAAPTKRKTSRTKSGSAQQKTKKISAGDKRERSRKSKKPAKSSERKIAEEGSKRKGTGQKETSSKARKERASPTKRKTSKTKSGSAQQKTKKTSAGGKRERSKESKKPAKSSKRKIAERADKRKGTAYQEDEEPAKKKIAMGLDFTRGITYACKVFRDELDVSVKRDANKKLSTIMEDITHRLLARAVELAGSQDELTTDHMERATREILPEVLAEHAILSHKNKPLHSHKKVTK